MGRLLTLIWLKARMWRHGLRSGTGVADAAAGVAMSILALLFSLGMTAAAGALLHYRLLADDMDRVRIVLLAIGYYSALFAVVVPVFFGLERAGMPIRRLAVFPLSRGALYRLSLFASCAAGLHLLWLPSLLAAFLVAVVGHGADPLAWGAFLGMLGCCLLVWCHTALLIVQRLTARRSAREILAIVAFATLMIASVTPAAIGSLEEETEDGISRILEVLAGAARAASVLPPSLAADGLVAAHAGYSDALVPGLGSLGWLTAWTAAGVGLGFLVFARGLRDGGGPPASRSGAGAGRGLPGVDRLTWLPGAVRAVAAKELRYLLRSTVGRFSLAMVPVIMIVVSLAFDKAITTSFLGVDPTGVLFLGAMLYASIFSSNSVFNAFAWERGGMRTYFMFPVDPRHVILGKNLGMWLYNAIIAAECVIVFVLVAGSPGVAMIMSGWLTFAAALLAATLTGNFISAAFPVSRDISRVANSPSQIGFLASLVVLATIASMIGGLAAIASLTGSLWVLPILLTALLTAEIGVYVALLGTAARFLAGRRERLVRAAQVAL